MYFKYSFELEIAGKRNCCNNLLDGCLEYTCNEERGGVGGGLVGGVGGWDAKNAWRGDRARVQHGGSGPVPALLKCSGVGIAEARAGVDQAEETLVDYSPCSVRYTAASNRYSAYSTTRTAVVLPRRSTVP